MSDKPNNPNAFPFVIPEGVNQGMTLRDYFAAAALQGILSKYSMSDLTEVSVAVLRKNEPAMFAVEVAFEFADEMLKAREV